MVDNTHGSTTSSRGHSFGFDVARCYAAAFVDAELTLPFAALASADLPRVGGKGANLGEMVGAGVPVPGGFCVTTAAFDRFIDACPSAAALMDAVDELDAADLAGIRERGAALREALEATAIPSALVDAITTAFAELDEGHAWAVRSSATLEDLAEASFAGQQDTYLGVRGREQLLDRVRACWASLFTDRAIAYRRQHGSGSRAAKLSVVIQRMVASEVSGILFTADPLSGHRGVASIDASWGLGEALVSGIVEADNYRVDRRSGALLELRLGPRPSRSSRRSKARPSARSSRRAASSGRSTTSSWPRSWPSPPGSRPTTARPRTSSGASRPASCSWSRPGRSRRCTQSRAAPTTAGSTSTSASTTSRS